MLKMIPETPPTNEIELNSVEIHEIITSVPSWIIRLGTTLVFSILILIVLFSSIISYPEIIQAQLQVTSLNIPKIVSAKLTGKITTLLVHEGERVKKGDALAFMESTANHLDVLQLQMLLLKFNKEIKSPHVIYSFVAPNLNLGELQGDYQQFYEQYLEFVSAQEGGYYIKKKSFLQKDLLGLKKIDEQLKLQQKVQMQELKNKGELFAAYKKLYGKKVISESEYKQQENAFLSSQYPLQSTATGILNNVTAFAAKQREIMEMDHIAIEQRSKFQQALSSLITKTSSWLNLYVLRAPVTGSVNYAGIVQQDQTVVLSQELFIIDPSNTDFFGEIQVPQYNMGKVKLGQTALVKMKSFPFEQYGIIRGKVNYISNVAIKDSIFYAKVNFSKNGNRETKIRLKNGMRGDVQIITEESTLLQRFLRNITSMIDH